LEDNMKRNFFFLIMLIVLTGCITINQPGASPQATTAVQETSAADPTPTLSSPVPTTAVQPTDLLPATALPAATLMATVAVIPVVTVMPTAVAPLPAGNGQTAEELLGEEAILIQEPGPGWRLTSPIRVAGIADPTFEQNLVVRLLLDDGSELALVPVTIASDLGQRGPFSVDIPFTVSGEQQAFIQVYASSARDGGLTHLSSVGLTIADSGPENRPPFTPMDERIRILQPLFNAIVSGGMVRVEGVAVASFEQTLLVEILDEEGEVVSAASVTLNAADLGMPGFFQVDIPYFAGLRGPGRVVVRDISPAFGGDVHLASVEIRFE
jgi:hypothetical protein